MKWWLAGGFGLSECERPTDGCFGRAMLMTLRGPSLPKLLWSRHATITGTIDAERLAAHKSFSGTLSLHGRTARYRFHFESDDGAALEGLAEQELVWGRPPRGFSVMAGTIRRRHDDKRATIATMRLRFDPRSGIRALFSEG